MNLFVKRLNELMVECHQSVDDIAKYLGIKHTSNIYEWLEGNTKPRILNLIKLANLFECPIDYLIGRSENNDKTYNNNIPPFSQQFKKVLKSVGKKQCDLLNNKIVSNGHLDNIRKNKYLLLDAMIKIADYLGVSIDFLIGRE